MEEMTRKQPDVDRVTKTYKRKILEPAHAPFMEKSRGGSSTWSPLGRRRPSCSLRMSIAKTIWDWNENLFLKLTFLRQ